MDLFSRIFLSSPVGRTVGNKPHEVLSVQCALNRHMACKMGYRLIPEDGRISPDTIQAILIFQKMVGIQPADSIILPNGPTHQALCRDHIRMIQPTVACRIADHAQIRKVLISRLGIVERSQWGATDPSSVPHSDWDYRAIALHHAGNSFSCGMNGIEALRTAERIDLGSFGQLSYHYAIDCQGTIYEALDIRHRGAHIEKGNTGVIGIVFLSDFSQRGEAGDHGPGVAPAFKKRGMVGGVSEFLGVQKDKLDFSNDEPSDFQRSAAKNLVSTLKEFFPIKTLGGHREFAAAAGSSRACPGVHGLAMAQQLRTHFGLMQP